MKINRSLLPQIKDLLIPGKVLVFYGPRQVGKTTLAKDLIVGAYLYRDILEHEGGAALR